MALKLSQLDGTQGFRLDAFDSNAVSRLSVAGAGDVNGDGLDDVIIGADYADPGGRDRAGESYVVFGSVAGFGANLDLDALDGATGFRLEGISAYDHSGFSVAGAGDVNGDGVDDLIIGAPGARENYVVFGTSAGFAASFDLSALDGANGFRLDGSGSSVAGAGDINGDGVDDLIIGDPGADPDGTYSPTGASYVVFGTSAGFAASLDLAALDGVNGFRLDGVDGRDASGGSVAGAGDVNGDGVDDLIIGAREANSYAGESYVVFGSAAGFAAELDLAALDGANGFRIDGIDQRDGSGGSVAGAGDVNGDGVDDLIIGAASADHGVGFSAGESYVVFGSAAGFAAELDLAALDGEIGFRIDGIDANDVAGVSVAGAGDVNGDGVDDLIIGATGADPGGRDGAGESYVVFGTSAGFAASLDLASLGGANGFRIEGIDEGDRTGLSVAGAGDVNGDGVDDLVLGSAFADNGTGFADNGIGKSFVVFGSAQLGGANDAPTAADDALSVRSLDVLDLTGDNGSGYDRDPNLDDLTITAIDGTPVTTGDRVTLASGLRVTFLGATEVRFDAPGVALGTILSDSFVYEISDGRGGSDTATVSVDYRQDAIDLAALDGATGFRLDGIAASDQSGTSGAGAGDVNGDGIDDLIIGAPFADPGGRNYAGESYVVFGTSAGFAPSLDLAALDGENGFRLANIVDGYRIGVSVAGAGDVNGDGVDDLIIAAERNGVLDPGYSYVVFGSTAGFSASLDLDALDGDNGFRLDRSADSVAGAGDINGDGVDDLIITGPYGLNSDDGSFVVFGSRIGFAANLDLASLDGTDGFRLRENQLDGSSVAGAGDINGDGVDDLIIGGPGESGPEEDPLFRGKSYVVFGSAEGFAASLDLAALDGENGFNVEGLDQGDRTGVSVAGAGDVNGDGVDDVIIGSVFAENGAGESYVVFGSAEGFAASLDLASLDGTNGFRLEGADGVDTVRDESVVSVASAGDFNGDGVDDLIVGSLTAGPHGELSVYAGKSYVVFGSAAGFEASLDLAALDGTDGFRLDGIDAGDGSGRSVASAGDVNGDGLDDLIIGAPYADPGGRSDAGESYVVFGIRSGAPGAGSTSASVAATSDDAEQRTACARVVSCSQELEIGETAKKLVGLRFTGLEVPDGATVTDAYIEFEAASSDAGASRIAIALEDATSAATFGRCAGGISARPYLEETTSWSPEAWVKGETYRTADLAATISALIGTEGLDPDDALAFRFKGEGEREAAAFESAGAAPKLVIDYEAGLPNDRVASVDDLAEADGFPEAPLDRSSAGSWDDLC